MALRALGAEPVVCDVFDAVGVRAPVAASGLSRDAPAHRPPRRRRRAFAKNGGANARIRRQGTRNLLAAAGAAGAERGVPRAWPGRLPADGGAAVTEMEPMVLAAGGVVLRYGQFYGPGTYHPKGPPAPPRVHIDAAARRTVDRSTRRPESSR